MNYLDQLKQKNPGIANYTDEQIIAILPKFNPRLQGMSQEEVEAFAMSEPTHIEQLKLDEPNITRYTDEQIISVLPKLKPELQYLKPEELNAYANMTPTELERSWGEVGTDLGAAAASSAGSMAKNNAWMAEKLTQDKSRSSTPLGIGLGLLDSVGAFDTMKELGKNAQEYWQDKKSLDIKIQRGKVNAADGFFDTLAEVNFATAGDIAADSAAYMVPGALLARLQAGAQGAASVLAYSEGIQEAADAGQSAEERVNNLTPADLAVNSSTYRDLRADGKTHDEALEVVRNRAGLTAFAFTLPISVLASKLTGSAQVEANFWRGEGLDGLVDTVTRETVQEIFQEGGNMTSQNIGVKMNADARVGVTDNVGNASAQGAVGGGVMGSGMYAAQSLVNPVPDSRLSEEELDYLVNRAGMHAWQEGGDNLDAELAMTQEYERQTPDRLSIDWDGVEKRDYVAGEQRYTQEEKDAWGRKNEQAYDGQFGTARNTALEGELVDDQLIRGTSWVIPDTTLGRDEQRPRINAPNTQGQPWEDSSSTINMGQETNDGVINLRSDTPTPDPRVGRNVVEREATAKATKLPPGKGNENPRVTATQTDIIDQQLQDQQFAAMVNTESTEPVQEPVQDKPVKKALGRYSDLDITENKTDATDDQLESASLMFGEDDSFFGKFETHGRGTVEAMLDAVGVPHSKRDSRATMIRRWKNRIRDIEAQQSGTEVEQKRQLKPETLAVMYGNWEPSTFQDSRYFDRPSLEDVADSLGVPYTSTTTKTKLATAVYERIQEVKAQGDGTITPTAEMLTENANADIRAEAQAEVAAEQAGTRITSNQDGNSGDKGSSFSSASANTYNIEENGEVVGTITQMDNVALNRINPDFAGRGKVWMAQYNDGRETVMDQDLNKLRSKLGTPKSAPAGDPSKVRLVTKEKNGREVIYLEGDTQDVRAFIDQEKAVSGKKMPIAAPSKQTGVASISFSESQQRARDFASRLANNEQAAVINDPEIEAQNKVAIEEYKAYADSWAYMDKTHSMAELRRKAKAAGIKVERGANKMSLAKAIIEKGKRLSEASNQKPTQSPTVSADDPRAAKGGQAKAGGEYGVNGEFYKGGQFMPASAFTVKGARKIDKKKGTGKVLIAPGEFAVAPEGYKGSIFSSVQEFVTIDHDGKMVRFRHSDETMRRNGRSLASIQRDIDLFNSGERFFPEKTPKQKRDERMRVAKEVMDEQIENNEELYNAFEPSGFDEWLESQSDSGNSVNEDEGTGYKPILNKVDRKTTLGRLSDTERDALITDAVRLFGLNGQGDESVENLLRSARLVKSKFPVSDGWEPLELLGLAFDEKKGKVSLKWKAIPYGFNKRTLEAKAKPQLDTRLVQQVADQFEILIDDIYDRAAAGDKNANIILKHQGWYRNVTAVLRQEFGGATDIFGELLGATSPNTPVDTNYKFALDILGRFVRGDFDQELSKLQAHLDNGGTIGSFKSKDKIRQVSKALYGMNSGGAMQALLDVWRRIEPGSAPKAKNFALNLIGMSDMATIDVWAARMLRRAAGKVRGNKMGRIPVPAEVGLSGTWSADGSRVTGEFGFGAAVLDEVAQRMQDKGRDLTAPDLQAIAWFGEKELWGTNRWTTVTGEGGSFEENMEANPGTRFTAGFSIQQGEEDPSLDDISAAQDRILSAMLGDDTVIVGRAMPTVGLYDEVIESSFDVEWTAKANEHDPSDIIAELSKLAKENSQYDIFVSRVLPGDSDSKNARPGVEVYFRTTQDLNDARPTLAAFTEQGQDGFTMVVDPRPNREGYIGVRLQFIPEISARWDEEFTAQALADGGIERILEEKSAILNQVVATLASRGGVAYANSFNYDTLVIGKENYDEYTDRAPGARDSETGERVRFPESVRAGLEAAARRYEGERGDEQSAGLSPSSDSVPSNQLEEPTSSYERDPEKQTEADDRAIEAAERTVNQFARLRSGSLLANKIAADFRDRGHTSLIGQEVKNHSELADLAEVYRNPSFETFRIIMMQGDKVVHQTGITSRMPAAVALWKDDEGFFDLMREMRDTMGRTKADGYYIMHNHPSGNPTPSRADIVITERINKALTGMKGHMVINGTKYVMINPDSSIDHFTKYRVDTYDETDPYNQLMPHPLLNKTISNAFELYNVAAELRDGSENHFQLISISKNGVSGIASFPDSMLDGEMTERKRLRLIAELRQFNRRTAAQMTFAVNVDPQYRSVFTEGMKNGSLTDVLLRGDPGDQSLGYQGVVVEKRIKNKPYRVSEGNEPGYDSGSMKVMGWSSKRLDNAIAEVADRVRDTAKGHVAMINPADFVKATITEDTNYYPNWADLEKEASDLDIEALANEGQIPFLRIENGKIVGHEGRHRMMAMHKAGYTSVPVLIKTGRYGAQVPLNLQQQFDPGIIKLQQSLEATPSNKAAIEAMFNDSNSVFEDTSSYSVESPTGSYDPKGRKRASETHTDLSDDQKSFLDKIAPTTMKESLEERWNDLKQDWSLKFRQAVIDRYASLEALDKKVWGSDVIEDNTEHASWVLAKMSSSADGAIGAMMNNGRIEMKGGAITLRDKANTNSGLLNVFAKLGDNTEVERFFGWIAAKRSQQLMKQDRELLFSEDEIAGGVKLNLGITAKGEERQPLYNTVYKEFQKYRDDVLTIADDNGLLKKGMEPDDAIMYLAKTHEVDMPLYNKIKKAQRAVRKKAAEGMDEEDYLLAGGDKVGEMFDQLLEKVEALDNFQDEYDYLTTDQKDLWMNEFYVPFYRVLEDINAAGGPKQTKGLTRQEAYKKLKGSKRPLKDLMENTIHNFHHLLDASLKNQAATIALHNAEQAGVAEQIPEHRKNKKTSTYILKDGMKVWYNINDPLVYNALTSINTSGFNNPVMRGLRWFKRLLTMTVTSSPQFWAANSIRDSLQATAIGNISFNAPKNFGQGVIDYGTPLAPGKLRGEMLASGGAFSFGHLYGTGNAEEIHKELERMIKGAQVIRGPEDIGPMIRKAWDFYAGFGDAFENANRAAIYKQNLEKGELYASFMARDLMDFSARGDNAAVMFLVDTVPFLNARIQGLDRLHRGGIRPNINVAKGIWGDEQASDTDRKAAKRFNMVVGGLALASILLYLKNRDDEEYKKLEEWQKDAYWYIRVGEHQFFIPKPFEVGAIATVAERSVEQMVDDEATGKLFMERIAHMLTDTFAFNPTPQAVAPLVDLRANKDSFTGRPIEGQADQRLSKNLRKDQNTTIVAETIAETANLAGEVISPKQVDFLIEGYFGWLGGLITQTADSIYRQADGQSTPAKEWYEYQPFRRFYQNTQHPTYTKYGTEFYEYVRQAGQAYADTKYLSQMEGKAEAIANASDKKAILQARPAINKAQQAITKINQQIKLTRANKSLSSRAKRAKLDQLQTMKNAIQERVVNLVKAKETALAE